MLVPRILQKSIQEKINKGKIIILYGARQTGKTTIVQNIIKKIDKPYLYVDFEYPDNRKLFENVGLEKLRVLLSKYEYVFFDEAQKLMNIGQTLKLIHDHLSSVKIIATGSSSFDLSNKINEPLTGRKYEFSLYPLSVKELSDFKSTIFLESSLENFLRYGSYPTVFEHSEEEMENILNELSQNYLFKDVFDFQDIRNPEMLNRLVRLLALQIASKVSYHELAQQLGVNQETVVKYIQLLEKAFVVFRLPAFSRNQRKELSKSKKIYFWDLGMRNSLIID